MDILKNKHINEYNYISRYSSFYSSYNTLDEKYITEITKQLKTDNVNYVLYTVKQNDTLDFLANKYYGRPDLYWVLADFNRIQDPFIQLWGTYKEIKIPSITAVSFE